ncbi:MAG: branched-chain amino acid ABC transporter permease, partial [Acidimicrobiia bacterium]|nr:branched-chain amino acid ABC transporter permease [Acidimicrobiia bacterium]
TVRYDAPIWIALVAAFLLTGVVSVVLGLITLRIKGHYFAIATLGMAEAVRVLVNAARPITQGAIGFPLPIDLIKISPLVPYYVALGTLVLIVTVSALILGSDFGLRLLAIREDEIGAEALGVATSQAKIAAFVISGALTGLLGGVFAWVLNFLSPESVLIPAVSLQIVVMVIVGGMGTIAGPLVGGLGFYLLSEFALINAPRLNLAILGSILVIAMLFFRRGIFGSLQASRWWPKGLRI